MTDLGDVSTLVRGVSYKKEDARQTATKELVPVLRATNITGSALTFENLVYVPDRYVSDTQRLKTGDIVIASSSGSKEIVGKSGQVSSNPLNASFGAFCTTVRPEAEISARYLGFYFQSPVYREAISEISAGSNINNVKSSELIAHQVPVAPKSEQTRIVEKLEELLSDLDAGVDELKAAQRKVAQYRQSLLKAAVEGTLSAGTSGHPEIPLGKLVRSIGQGWSPRCERKSVDGDDDWAVIKTTAIQPLAFDGAHNKKLPPALTPREHLELEVGDLLMTRAGPRSRVGITCLVRKVKKRLILCDKAYRVRCDESRINNEFLEIVLNAPQMMSGIDELKTGINDSGLNLTQDRLFTLMIPVPSLDKQRDLVEQIHTQIQCIEDQELAIELSLKQSAAQRKNILKAAFAGQLVPQDPNDEPASVMLERIRAERAAEGRTATRKRGRKAKESA